MNEETEVAAAFKVIRQAMIDDEPGVPGSYAHGWHCIIAMMCYDAMRAGLEESDQFFHDDALKVSHDAASRFMEMCFGVETKA